MKYELEELSGIVIDKSIGVHKSLGPGLLESAYSECLYYELLGNGLKIDRQKEMPLIYDDVVLDIGYRLDFLIDDKLIIELKSVEALNDVHMAQIMTYLKLSKCKVGLLINFNVKLLKNGIRRVVM